MSDADVIELRDRQVVGLPPGVRPVIGDPHAAVVAGDQCIGIVRIDPDVVEIAVGAVGDVTEALAAIVAEDQAQVRLEEFIFVLGIHDQIGKIKRAPDHQIAPVALLPGLAAVVRTEQGAARGFDQSVNHFGIGRSDGNRDASPGLGRQTFRRLVVELGPAGSRRRRMRKKALPLGAVGFSPPERKVQPLRRKSHKPSVDDLGILGIHGDHGAAGRQVAALEDLVPGLATVGGLVKAAVFAVAPELAGNAGVNRRCRPSDR